MKVCPFCAEEIQAAAIVCKHCHRDLGVTPTRPRWGRRVLFAVGAVVVAVIGLVYVGEDHQRFIAFTAQRDAWHRKCDLYTGKTPAELGSDAQEARGCAAELDELMAYAKRQGWN